MSMFCTCLIVCAHGQQLIDGRVDGTLIRTQHGFDDLLVHVREHRLEIGHRLGEFQLHRCRCSDSGIIAARCAATAAVATSSICACRRRR